MSMTLYCMDPSPPNRAVYLCLEALGLKPERKPINLLNKEQLDASFVKMNPQHTVPTLKDGDFTIWDSHAICCYLVSKYGKDDSLYPKDLQKRALVDQRLHFDTGVLFPRLRDITFPLLFLKCKEIPEEKRKNVIQAYDFMELFLEGRDYLAGDNYTVADFCCVATVSSLAGPLRIPLDNHPRTKAWLKRCEENMPNYKEAQASGLQIIKALIDAELN